MEEAAENGKELSHSAYADGMNEYMGTFHIICSICVSLYSTFLMMALQRSKPVEGTL
jgi:hypothetical protein